MTASSSPQDPDPGFPISLALQRAIDSSSHSWEYGTLSQALLEYHTPTSSIFSPNPFPSGRLPILPADTPALAYARQHISLDGPTLFADDSIGVSDPCSLGVSALLVGQTDKRYLDAAKEQVEYVLNEAPRLPNGAISHRTDVKEAWADFVYMLPPFLAYAAVAFRDADLLREAVRQCEAYREVLINDAEGSRSKGLWRHIGPKGCRHEDEGFWSTSCGWAAMGMARVLAVVLKYPAELTSDGRSLDTRSTETNPTTITREEVSLMTVKLVDWIEEILLAAMRVDEHSSGLLRNYLDDATYFPDVAGTALLAAAAYRLAVLTRTVSSSAHFSPPASPAPQEASSASSPTTPTNSPAYVAWAESKRAMIARHVDTKTGIASPVCKSLDHKRKTPLDPCQGEINPEAQSFVVMLGSAWRGWAGTRGVGEVDGERENITTMGAD